MSGSAEQNSKQLFIFSVKVFFKQIKDYIHFFMRRKRRKSEVFCFHNLYLIYWSVFPL